jgi:hypothetical protein
MDPFLEDAAIFPDLHDRLITYSSEALNAQLPEPYYARIGSRAWIETSQRLIEPDVNVLRKPQTVNGGGPVVGGGGVAVATAVATDPVVIRVPVDTIRETFIELYARRGGERLVTTIEVLSLSNKTPGAHGRDLYLQKQREVLRGEVHLVEIDLHRAGTHTTAVPLAPALAQTGPFDYHVCVHRFDRFDEYVVYAIRLAARLPVLAVPLLPGDADVRFDLQAVLDRCYDTGLYRRSINYRTLAPVPPLTPEQATWAEQWLRARGALETPPSPGPNNPGSQ